ncbi:MAG: tetratricopeptide repeat protein, partial [Planctomycetota bacterium]
MRFAFCVLLGMGMPLTASFAVDNANSDSSLRTAFYGIVPRVTTDQQLLANRDWKNGRPLKITPQETIANLREYRFGIWPQIRVGISYGGIVETIDVWAPDRTRADELVEVFGLEPPVPARDAAVLVSTHPYFGFRPTEFAQYVCPRSGVTLFMQLIDGQRYVELIRFHQPFRTAWGRGLRWWAESEPWLSVDQRHSIAGVTPGVTTAQELQDDKHWGKPVRSQSYPGGETWLEYSLDRWKRATVVVRQGVVTTVDLEPSQSASPKALAQSLNLGQVESLPDWWQLPVEALIGPTMLRHWTAHRCGGAKDVVFFAKPVDAQPAVVTRVRFYAPPMKPRSILMYQDVLPGRTLVDELDSMSVWSEPTRRQQRGRWDVWQYEGPAFKPWDHVELTIDDGLIRYIDLLPPPETDLASVSSQTGVDHLVLRESALASRPTDRWGWWPSDASRAAECRLSRTLLFVKHEHDTILTLGQMIGRFTIDQLSRHEAEAYPTRTVTRVRLLGVDRPLFGAEVRPWVDNESTATDKSGSGLRVVKVLPQSAAAKAGIRKNDKLVSISGRPMESFADFSALIQSSSVGARHRVELIRDGQSKSLEVTLQSRTGMMRYRHAALGSRDSGRLQVAQQLATRVIELAPSEPTAWLVRAEIREQLGRWQSGLADAERAGELDPNDGWARYRRSRLLARQGRFAEAFHACDATTGRIPSAATSELRAFLWAEQGDWERALAEANTAVESDSELAFALMRRGSIEQKLNRQDDALVDLQQAWKRAPGHFDINLLYGQVLHDVGSPEEAIAVWAGLVRRYPNHDRRGEVYRNIAGAYHAQGQDLDAWDYLQKAFAADP